MNQYSILILSILLLIATLQNFCNGAPTADVPLEEQGGFFEGDLNLTPSQIRDIFVNKNAGLMNTHYRWSRDSAGFVTIPFSVRSGTPYGQAQHNIIRLAMNEIERNTCVRFIPRTNQRDYIEIFSGSGCWSRVGRNGGMQELSLAHSSFGQTCVTNGIVMHELIHALGFYHMQSSPNRDEFVRINHENILNGMEHNFLKYDTNFVGLFSTSYDVDSIMHYSRASFSRNGRDTITTRNPNHQSRIGQRTRMSQGDIARIRNMYNCS